MKFTASEVVRGYSNMAYNIDGQTAQVKVIFIDVEMNAEHGGMGTRTDAKQVSEPAIIEQAFKGRSFPVVCELDFEERATKGKVSMVCVGIRPKLVDPLKKAA